MTKEGIIIQVAIIKLSRLIKLCFMAKRPLDHPRHFAFITADTFVLLRNLLRSCCEFVKSSSLSGNINHYHLTSDRDVIIFDQLESR